MIGAAVTVGVVVEEVAAEAVAVEAEVEAEVAVAVAVEAVEVEAVKPSKEAKAFSRCRSSKARCI